MNRNGPELGNIKLLPSPAIEATYPCKHVIDVSMESLGDNLFRIPALYIGCPKCAAKPCVMPVIKGIELEFTPPSSIAHPVPGLDTA